MMVLNKTKTKTSNLLIRKEVPSRTATKGSQETNTWKKTISRTKSNHTTTMLTIKMSKSINSQKINSCINLRLAKMLELTSNSNTRMSFHKLFKDRVNKSRLARLL